MFGSVELTVGVGQGKGLGTLVVCNYLNGTVGTKRYCGVILRTGTVTGSSCMSQGLVTSQAVAAQTTVKLKRCWW